MSISHDRERHGVGGRGVATEIGFASGPVAAALTRGETQGSVTQLGRGVAEVFGRAAHTYGRVGPDFFGFFGRRIVAMIGGTLGGSVLDVGCGAGATLVA